MPRLTLRLLALASLAAGLVVAVVLVTLVAIGRVTAPVAALLAFAAMVVGALGIVAVLLRRIDRRTLVGRGAEAAVIQQHLVSGADELGNVVQHVTDVLHDLRGSIGEDRVELLDRLERVDGHFERLTDQLDYVRQDLRAELEGLRQRQDRFPAKVFGMLEAHSDLRALVNPRAPMPSLTGWALSPTVLHKVASALWGRQPKLVVECGSGSSSVWLGYLVERLAIGRVVSLEHDERYLGATRALIRAHGLEGVVQVRHAPLESWSDGGTDYSWYARSSIEDLAEIGLLLVDGPPGASGHLARYPAGPLLLPRCVDGATVVLDDTNRDDEMAISRRWLADWPGLTRTVHGGESSQVFEWGAHSSEGHENP